MLEFSHRLDLLEDTTIQDLEKQCGEIARMLKALTRSIRRTKKSESIRFKPLFSPSISLSLVTGPGHSDTCIHSNTKTLLL